MYAKFMRHWIDAKNDGYSFSEQFARKGWNNVIIYGCGTLGRILYDEIHKNINIKCFVDSNANTYKGKISCGTNSVEVIEPSCIKKVENIDAIIITPFFSFFKIRKRIKHYTSAPIASIRDVLSEAKSEDEFIEMSKFLVSKGVSLHLMSRPELDTIDNPSIFEQAIMFGLRQQDAAGTVLQYDFIKMLYDDIEYFNEEYFNQLILNNITLEKNMEANTEVIFKDVRSQFFNIVNGNRFIPDFPDSYRNIAYLFGDCYIRGAYAEDKLSLANQLQIKLNNKKSGYGVIAGASTIQSISYLFKKIKSLPLKQGDTVIYVNWAFHNNDHNHNFFYNLPNIFEYDLTSALSRPHGMGEIFLDMMHITHKGYTLVANEIYNAVISNIYNYQNKCIAYNQNDYPDGSEQNTIERFIQSLKSEKVAISGKIGAVVVNCNPFTLGHLHLIETAAKQVDFLYVFVIEEDKSIFSFKNRMLLVKQGVAHIKNIKVLSSGKYLISTTTFPIYFEKEKMPNVDIDASEDVLIFAAKIAPVLNISVRFAGNEPYCMITKQYNRDMHNILPQHGIEFCEIDRLTYHDIPISATIVRELLAEEKMNEIKNLVPGTTFDFLMNSSVKKQNS